jgi:hypothetical protein
MAPTRIGASPEPLPAELLQLNALRAPSLSWSLVPTHGGNAFDASETRPAGGWLPELNLEIDGVVLAGVAVSFSVVAWSARAGMLMTSMLVSTPAWRSFDLLPVLGSRRESRKGSDDEQVATRVRASPKRRDQQVEELL